eukprot:gene28-50_t
MASNPLPYILKGMNDIWILGDAAWANGGANGDGPDDFSQTQILNASVWKHNIAYTQQVCAKRTAAEAVYAYFDESQDHNHAVLDGLGPLLETYVAETQAFSTIAIDESTVLDTGRLEQNDQGNGAGNAGSNLGKIVDIVRMMRQASASTSGSKYYFSTPRPWRMTDEGTVVNLGFETLQCHDGNGHTESLVKDVYDTNVTILPALACVRRSSKTDAAGNFVSSSQGKDGGYPSGHTNAGYLAALGIAYAVPERFAEMWTRASQMGENRILTGLHSPLDVMGGRIHATAIVAAALNNPSNAQLKNEAVQQAKAFFSGFLGAGQTLFEFAHASETGRWGDHDANKKLFRWRMTYGFEQDTSKSGQPLTVPLGAESLLESRQPYLTPEQR